MMYEVFEEKCVNDEAGVYVSYGVKCVTSEMTVADVTCNKDKLISFVNMLNEEKVEPIHLFDVIEDNINELI